MAWHEPGNNSNNSNKQDPWSKRPSSNDGPPDLDEALRKIQDAFSEIFGGGKKSSNKSNNGNGNNYSPKLAIFVMLVVVASFWLYKSVYVVDEQEQAIVLRLGKYHRTVGPGLNIYFPPFERKFQENVTRERSYSKQGQMLTEDENIIEVPLTVQYKIVNLKDFVLNVDNPELSLQLSTDSAVRHVVGSTSMDKVLTEGREEMSDEVKLRLQGFLDNYGTGITITQVNLQSTAAPKDVQKAFDDVIRAREEEQQSKNHAESYANGVIPEARGKAQRMREEASAYRDEVIAQAQGEAERFNKLFAEYKKAPEVTRQRLYLETMQEVMQNSSKVLITSEQNNNLMMLPLDKVIAAGVANDLLQKGAENSANSRLPSAAASSISHSSQTGTPQNDLRVRGTR